MTLDTGFTKFVGKWPVWVTYLAKKVIMALDQVTSENPDWLEVLSPYFTVQNKQN